MIAVVFIVEVIAGVLAFVLMDHIQDTLTVYLHAAMIHYQDNHDLHVAIDYIQSKVRPHSFVMFSFPTQKVRLQSCIISNGFQNQLVSRQLMCCGAADYNDWELNIYYNCSSPAQDRLVVAFFTNLARRVKLH